MTATLSPRPVRRKAQQRLTPEQVTTLVEAVAAGDQRAWDSLIQAFGPMIWSIALAHRLREADAGDVAQATWLAAEMADHPGAAGLRALHLVQDR